MYAKDVDLETKTKRIFKSSGSEKRENNVLKTLHKKR